MQYIYYYYYFDKKYVSGSLHSKQGQNSLNFFLLQKFEDSTVKQFDRVRYVNRKTEVEKEKKKREIITTKLEENVRLAVGRSSRCRQFLGIFVWIRIWMWFNFILAHFVLDRIKQLEICLVQIYGVPGFIRSSETSVESQRNLSFSVLFSGL